MEYVRNVGGDERDVTEIPDDDLEKHFSRYFFTLQVEKDLRESFKKKEMVKFGNLSQISSPLRKPIFESLKLFKIIF